MNMNIKSPIDFTAYERPAIYVNKAGEQFPTEHKVLFRMDEDNTKPVFLNTVRNSYGLVQNRDLFGEVSASVAMINGNFTTQDSTAHNGRTCSRKYIFDDIMFESPEKKPVKFSIIVVNGFGTTAVKVYAGAIDFFCMNGIVLGDFNSSYTRHSSNVQLTKFTSAIEAGLLAFKSHEFFVETMAKREVNTLKVHEWLEEHFSKSLATKLYNTYITERDTRGNTLWAVHSALTNYASHNDNEYSIRNTSTDHEAVTMLKRATTINKYINEPSFLQLVA